VTALALPESPATARGRFVIEPVRPIGVPEVAAFLHRYGQGDPVPATERPAREALATIERHLQWLLIDNPLASPEADIGLCIRDEAGAMAGLDLFFRGAFLAGSGRRLLGLGSGTYFVEPRARMLGYFLFTRYLRTAGYDMFYSTTCNASSAALWASMGATAVSASDIEYLLPFRFDVLLPALLGRRTTSGAVARLARLGARCATPVLTRLARRRPRLTVSRCADWDKLAELARRHRPADLITSDRSAALLQWRYGPSSPNQPFDVHRIADARGNEGWFALGSIRRGRQREIRGRVLLDAIWPRSAMSFTDVLSAVAGAAAPGADALYLNRRPGIGDGDWSRWLLPWRLESPRHFAVAAKGRPALPVEQLDLVAADGDGAF